MSSTLAPAVALPPDQRARDDITDRLDTTLFVEAGAGSGKTRAPVSYTHLTLPTILRV